MSKRSSLEAALLLLASGSVYASAYTGAPILVTATRIAETADEVLASVTVIDREEIERRQAVSIMDVLRGMPGIAISNSGGLGKATSVFMRGTNEDQVLVLIDGVKVGSATLGTTAFENIPIDQVDRIEIVRGPRSSLYGSEAIGGVIQIFTRKGGGATAPYARLSTGSHQTYEALGGVSGGGGAARYNVSVSDLTTKGFNACNGEPLVGGCFTFEPDDDGYRNRSAAFSAGYRFQNNVDLELQTLRAQGDNEFDGTFVNEGEFVQQVIGSKLRFSPAPPWQATLSAGSSRDDSENFLDGEFQSRFDTQRNVASFQNEISVGSTNIFTVGVDYQSDQLDSTVAFPVTSRADKGLFAQYQGVFRSQRVQLAVRVDDNDQFGHVTTGSLAWGHTFTNGARLFASYGTAFKAPTFNQLYFPGFGNANLQPEESTSVELGLNKDSPRVHWSLNVYQTVVDNLIVFDATFKPANIGAARIRGLEATTSTQAAGWTLGANLTALNTENLGSGPDHGKELPRRPNVILQTQADRTFGRFVFGVTLFGSSGSFDDLANTRKLARYATLDLFGRYTLRRHWAIGARIANLFDKQFETAKFFNQEGRAFFVTVWYHPAS